MFLIRAIKSILIGFGISFATVNISTATEVQGVLRGEQETASELYRVSTKERICPLGQERRFKSKLAELSKNNSTLQTYVFPTNNNESREETTCSPVCILVSSFFEEGASECDKNAHLLLKDHESDKFSWVVMKPCEDDTERPAIIYYLAACAGGDGDKPPVSNPWDYKPNDLLIFSPEEDDDRSLGYWIFFGGGLMHVNGSPSTHILEAVSTLSHLPKEYAKMSSGALGYGSEKVHRRGLRGGSKNFGGGWTSNNPTGGGWSSNPDFKNVGGSSGSSFWTGKSHPGANQGGRAGGSAWGTGWSKPSGSGTGSAKPLSGSKISGSK